ncbi:glycoside hydrolase [Mycena sp. CBHHK59/15]|nr:glycoside hydrolase [Mycena sp. CBHHK59/15]
MLVINMGGTFSNLKIELWSDNLFEGGNSVTVSGITVDNSAGSVANCRSGGNLLVRANTDGFDVAAHNVTIESSTVTNQDDCLAINRGTNIVFQGNTCSGGHGISVVRSLCILA